MFVIHLFKAGANLSNMSFWGLLFTLNYACIMGIIVAFWIKVNLVNTLWILVAATPITLLTMNKGLTTENTFIQSYLMKKGKH